MKLTYEEMQDIYIYLKYYEKDIPAHEWEKERINHLANRLHEILMMLPRKEVKP